MGKRFVDTDLWQKAWFWKLKPKHQWLVLYLFQNCDNAGVWHINYLMPNAIHGEVQFSDSDIDEINIINPMFEFIDDDKIFIVDFIQFQYGTLSENCKPHKPIIEKLKKYNLYQRVLKGYLYPLETLEEKEKEKDINKVINKNPDNIFNPIVKEFQKQMKEVLHNAIRLSIEQSNKVVELNQRIPDFAKTIPIVFERLKYIQWNFDGRLVSPDVNWLLEKENYISVLNGKYTTKQQIIQEKLKQKEAENDRR